jgi:hypothetical protein
MTQAKLPAGWDEDRVQRVLAHYDAQTEAQAVAEDEAVYGRSDQAIMGVPTALVPAVRELIAKHQK